MFTPDIKDWDQKDVQWLRVHTLTLVHAQVLTAVLERAFPAVRHLKVSLDMQPEWDTTPPAHVTINLAHQCTVWKRIPYLAGNVYGVWSLSLSQVNVGLLHVENFVCHPSQTPPLSDVVSRVQPEMMSLDHWAGGDFVAALGQIASRLRILDIQLFIQDLMPSDVLDCLVSHPPSIEPQIPPGFFV